MRKAVLNWRVRAFRSGLRLWLCAIAPTVPLALLAAQGTTNVERGEEIQNARCATACHDRRPIDVQALDEAGWKKVIDSMIEKGAEVEKDEGPILIAYLTRNHGPLPDGPGKDIVLTVCTQCHDLQRVRRQRSSAEGWAEILDTMLNEGAPLSADEFPVVLRYLARNFRPER
jgi:cytochrome c5